MYTIDFSNIPNWEAAICKQVDPELFYPERGNYHTVRKAKKICMLCPVILECRNFALREQVPFGIWGGMTYGERRKLLKLIKGEEDGEEFDALVG